MTCWLRALPLLPPHRNAQLGWPGAIGAGALSMCLAFYVSTVRPAQEQLEAARLSAQSLQARVTQAGLAPRERKLSLDEQLAVFYQRFPSEHEATDWVGKIAAIAQRDGLTLQQAEYKAERDKSGKLIRFQMNLPLKGEYPTLRRFLASLRTELPIVSLEQVQFERQKIGDPLIDAKVRLVIFLESAS